MKGRIYPTRDGYVVRFGRDVPKWFRDMPDAERFLTGLRCETDKGTFDPRDYAGDKLGVKDVDLYGGTRHSTVTALGERLSPEQIRSGTLHSTNKAFDGYFQGEARNVKMVYRLADQMQNSVERSSDKLKAKP